MNFKKNYKGMLLCLIIAIPCWFLGKKFPIVGGPVFGIILGMIITLFIKDKNELQSGITFTSKKNLKVCGYLVSIWNEFIGRVTNRKTIFTNHSSYYFYIFNCRLPVT